MNLSSVFNQLLISFTLAGTLILSSYLLEAHYPRFRKLISALYLFLTIYTSYAAILEYEYHRNSLTTLAKVSSVRYTSNFERSASHSCNLLRGGRIDCTEVVY